MSGEQEAVRACDQCGAIIRREEFKNRTAVRYKGKLLCPECVRTLMAKAAAKKSDVPTEGQGAPVGHQVEPVEGQPKPDDVPIALVGDDEVETAEGPSSQIHRFSGGEMTVQRTEQQYRRPLLKNTQSATRCRTFHCKMTDASFKNLNEQINEWVDENENLEIKFVVSNIGVVEGKHADPHLVITVFY